MIDQIKISAALIQRRDDMKRLFGDRWPAKVDEFRPVFAATMQKHNCGELDALIQIEREHGPVSSMLGSVLIAVAVELLEARK